MVVIWRPFPLLQGFGDSSKACWAIEDGRHEFSELLPGDLLFDAGCMLNGPNLACAAPLVFRANLLSRFFPGPDGFLKIWVESPLAGVSSSSLRDVARRCHLDGPCQASVGLLHGPRWICPGQDSLAVFLECPPVSLVVGSSRLPYP